MWRRLFSNIQCYCPLYIRRCYSLDNNSLSNNGNKISKAPEPPTTCCDENCPNCVWMDYARELALYYNDGGQKAMEAIEQIKNPVLKAYLKMELEIELKKTK